MADHRALTAHLFRELKELEAAVRNARDISEYASAETIQRMLDVCYCHLERATELRARMGGYES